MTHDTDQKCTCPDPWCPLLHARCGLCGGVFVIMDGDPAFCPSCGHDVTPDRAGRFTGEVSP